MKFKLLLFILACSFLDAYASNEASDNFIKALKASGGHRIKAARLLGINPATLYRRMKKYGLSDK